MPRPFKRGDCCMRVSPALTLGLALALSVRPAGAQSTPQTATEAHPAWTYSVASKCPELHAADDGPAAVVVFRVSDFGAPSQISVQTSSGSPALDEAAVKCVQKLKFQPRTRLGDGAPVDSWQKIGWRWQRPPAGAPAAAAPAALIGAPAAAAAARRPHPPEPRTCASARMMPDTSPRPLPWCAPRAMRASMRPRCGSRGRARATTAPPPASAASPHRGARRSRSASSPSSPIGPRKCRGSTPARCAA